MAFVPVCVIELLVACVNGQCGCDGLPPVPMRWVLIRDPLGQFATPAVPCTDRAAAPLPNVCWFTLRRQLEVTFREVRAPLGVATQRHWSERAIARTTPVLLGLFSLVTLLADDLLRTGTTFLCRHTAWYSRSQPTFADALALVRRHLWGHTTFPQPLRMPISSQSPVPSSRLG